MAKQPQSSQSKQSYIYSGPVTSFDVADKKSVSLVPGRSYQDLPTEHPIVKNLIERRLLVEETAQAPAADPASAAAETAGA